MFTFVGFGKLTFKVGITSGSGNQGDKLPGQPSDRLQLSIVTNFRNARKEVIDIYDITIM